MKPIVVGNPKNLLLKGLTEKPLQYALAKRKLTLTTPEKVLNKLLQGLASVYSVVVAIDSVFSSHSLPSLPANVTNNRVGALLLSSDFTSVQKFFIIESSPKNWNGTMGYSISSTNTQSNHLGLSDTYYLMKNYHSASWGINTLTSPATYPNQYLTFRDKEIPLCCSDFSILRDNNIINSYDGKKGRVDSIRWNPHTNTAKIDFRINETFTKNLLQTIVIDGN
jgi:hypothetical protein